MCNRTRPQGVELKVTITDTVADPHSARAVQLRLGEAHICQEHGTHTLVVIVLRSLLEGVLAHAAEVRPAAEPLFRDHLIWRVCGSR